MSVLSSSVAGTRAAPGQIAADGTVDVRQRSKLKAWVPRRGLLLGVVSVLVILGLWQLAVEQKWINPLFVATPTNSVSTLAKLIWHGTIWSDLAISGEEFAYGLLLSAVVGIVVGAVYGWYAVVREVLSPIVTAVNGMPQIALVPVFILFFGIGVASKVAIIFLMTVTTFLLNTATGMTTIDRRYIRVARSFGASDLQLFRTVALPHSLPYLLAGLRLAIGRALIGVVVGELFAAKGGVGHVLLDASDSFNVGEEFAMIVLITAIGIVLTSLIGLIERRYEAWRD